MRAAVGSRALPTVESLGSRESVVGWISQTDKFNVTGREAAVRQEKPIENKDRVGCTGRLLGCWLRLFARESESAL